MIEEFPGKRSTTIIETIQLENDNWGIEETIVHARSRDLVNWEEKRVSIKVVDKDLNRGMAQAILSLTQYLETVDYDLFTEQLEEGTQLM